MKTKLPIIEKSSNRNRNCLMYFKGIAFIKEYIVKEDEYSLIYGNMNKEFERNWSITSSVLPSFRKRFIMIRSRRNQYILEISRKMYKN